MSDGQSNRERILIVAPIGADASNIRSVLSKAGLFATVCPNIAALASALDAGCGTILLTEEALNDPGHQELAKALAQQPPWSDLPVVFIVSGGTKPANEADAVRLIGDRANITLVERPLRSGTLVSAVQAALRARRRQYEVSSLLQERDDLLASLEQRVADRTAKLEAVNRELEAFSYSVSHDLRAPLRSLEGYARILTEDFADQMPSEARHYAERIAKNADKMDRLTRDVLTLSQLAKGEIQMEALDLDAIIPEVIDQYPDLAAAANNIELRSPLGWVYAHAPSLTQCFSNLLQNALKFVPATRTPHILITSEIRAGRVRVWVQDNGQGIDPQHQKRIFGIFERASPANVPGTGIGLAIAKKAVERMGGTIGVESVVGKGARFWIDLAQPAASPVARQTVATAADGANGHATRWNSVGEA
jgi:signal transduction histidine kinase